MFTKKKMKSISKIFTVFVLTLCLVASLSISDLSKDSGKAYAEQATNLSGVRNVGDYYFAEVDTSGKTALGASLPTINHVAEVSGIYRLEIITPRGGGSFIQYDGANITGSPGQNLSVNIKIAKGSRFTTVGNLAEGIGIRGIIQVAGGNGLKVEKSINKDKNQINDGFFGGNGADGIVERSGSYYNITPASNRYFGGNGVNGKAWHNTSYVEVAYNGTDGGGGYFPGKGGNAAFYDSKHYGRGGRDGEKYMFVTGVNPINQDETGSVKYFVGGNFPTFRTTPNEGRIGSIKLTLIQKTNVNPNEGIVSVQFTEKESLQEIVKNTERIANAMEKGGFGGGSSSSTINASDIFVVVAGKNFNELIRVSNDSTNGGIAEGLTVINNNKQDGVVRVSGRFTRAENLTILVDGVYYHIKVVKEPDSASVTASFI